MKVVNSNGTRNGSYYNASFVSVGVYTLSDADAREAKNRGREGGDRGE